MTEDLRSSFDALTALSTLEEAAARSELAAHRRKLLALAARFPRGSPSTEVLMALGAALLLDLAFFRVHPSDLLSTLFWRCALQGCPETGALGALWRPQDGSGGLAMLVRRWAEEHAQRQSHSLGVRALGPPPFAPGGPLIAELRSAGPHTLLPSLSAEGQVLLGGGPARPHGAVLRWDLEEGTLTEEVRTEQPAAALSIVASGFDGAALHDAATGLRRLALAIPENGYAAAGALSSDGSMCALAGSVEEDTFGFVRLYESATGRLLREWRRPALFEKPPVFSRDGRCVLVPSHAGIYAFDVETDLAECLPVHDAEGVALSNDSRMLVTTDGQVVSAWDFERLRALGPRESQPTKPLAFSPDGRRLIAGDWLCDGGTGRRIRKLELPRVEYLVGGPPRHSLICGTQRILSFESIARAWETETGKLVVDGKKHYLHWHLIAGSTDGLRYAVANEHPLGVDMDADIGLDANTEAVLLDVDTGAVLAKFYTAGGALSSLALSPDGQRLAGGMKDGSIEIWSTATRKRLTTLSGHEAPVTELAFSLDGRHLVSAGDNEKLQLWELPFGKALASRPLDERDPDRGLLRTVWRRWEASPAALQALSGWEGFAGPAQGPLAAHVQGGITRFVERASGKPVAAFPSSGPWLAHPDGRTWASPVAHVIVAAPHDV